MTIQKPPDIGVKISFVLEAMKSPLLSEEQAKTSSKVESNKSLPSKEIPHSLSLEVRYPSQVYNQMACHVQLMRADILATDLTVSASASARNLSDLAIQGKDSLTSSTGVSERKCIQPLNPHLQIPSNTSGC